MRKLVGIMFLLAGLSLFARGVDHSNDLEDYTKVGACFNSGFSATFFVVKTRFSLEEVNGGSALIQLSGQDEIIDAQFSKNDFGALDFYSLTNGQMQKVVTLKKGEYYLSYLGMRLRCSIHY